MYVAIKSLPHTHRGWRKEYYLAGSVSKIGGYNGVHWDRFGSLLLYQLSKEESVPEHPPLPNRIVSNCWSQEWLVNLGKWASRSYMYMYIVRQGLMENKINHFWHGMRTAEGWDCDALQVWGERKGQTCSKHGSQWKTEQLLWTATYICGGLHQLWLGYLYHISLKLHNVETGKSCTTITWSWPDFFVFHRIHWRFSSSWWMDVDLVCCSQV